MKKDEADTINRKGLRWLFKWELSLGSEDLIPFTAFQSLNVGDECWWKKWLWIVWVTSSCQMEKGIEKVKMWWRGGMYLTNVHCAFNSVSQENNRN